VPGEPLRLQLAALHPPRHDNLERPLTELEIRNGRRRSDEVGRLLIGERPVSAVHVPVEFLLQRGHRASDANIFLDGACSSKQLSKPVAHAKQSERVVLAHKLGQHTIGTAPRDVNEHTITSGHIEVQN
jgi:hypothetical protein